MTTSATLQPIVFDFDEHWIPRPLSECLGELPVKISVCMSHPTKGNASRACDICRSAWAAYLQEWRNGDVGEKRHELEEGLQDCYDAVIVVANHVTKADVDLVRHYASNIKLRLQLIDVLHGPGGASAAEALMQLHIRKLKMVKH